MNLDGYRAWLTLPSYFYMFIFFFSLFFSESRKCLDGLGGFSLLLMVTDLYLYFYLYLWSSFLFRIYKGKLSVPRHRALSGKKKTLIVWLSQFRDVIFQEDKLFCMPCVCALCKNWSNNTELMKLIFLLPLRTSFPSSVFLLVFSYLQNINS